MSEKNSNIPPFDSLHVRMHAMNITSTEDSKFTLKFKIGRATTDRNKN